EGTRRSFAHHKREAREIVSGGLLNIVGPNSTNLDRECTVFARYLVGESPGGYVLEKYRDAHAKSALADIRVDDAFDRVLLHIALVHPVATKLVDAYTAFFFKTSTVRKKWVLLLAILESAPPAFHLFDSPDHGTTTSLVL